MSKIRWRLARRTLSDRGGPAMQPFKEPPFELRDGICVRTVFGQDSILKSKHCQRAGDIRDSLVQIRKHCSEKWARGGKGITAVNEQDQERSGEGMNAKGGMRRETRRRARLYKEGTGGVWMVDLTSDKEMTTMTCILGLAGRPSRISLKRTETPAAGGRSAGESEQPSL
jgi:hypothetical protein